MNFIDTHTHLFVSEFDEDRIEVINNALNSGISKMILPGINSSYIDIQLQTADTFPGVCFPAAGLHPSDVDKDFEKELIIVENNIKTNKFIAVGEIGIDLYWDKTYLEEQKAAFEKQIIIAKKYNFPIIIHVRDSFKEVFEITDKHNDENLSGIFHSFTGNAEDAERIINYGRFKIGINGIITFKNSGLDKIIEEIDINHLVLETDSPYLSPVPKRGKRNESANLIYIAERIAQIKGISVEELAKITNNNAIDVFGDKLILS